MPTIETWLQKNQNIYRQELRLLASNFLGLSKAELITRCSEDITPELIDYLTYNLQELKTGTPFFYLYGNREFWSIDFEVNEDVLIPRPETELLVEKAIKVVKCNGRVLELGTGSGAISIALAKERPDLNIVATDASVKALKVARRNINKQECKVNLIASDWFAGFRGSWDAIISNPPYIAQNDPHLLDLKKEPSMALVAGISGYEALFRIISEAHRHLNENGYIILEHGFDQATEIKRRLATSFYYDVTSYKDLNEIDRVTIAKRIQVNQHG